MHSGSEADPQRGDLGVSRAELRLALESLNLAVLVRTLDGLVVMVNEAFTRMFGYGREEVVGLHITKFVPEDRAYLVDQRSAAIRDGRTRGHSGNGVMLCKDESTLRIRINTTAVAHSGQVLVVNFIEDWSDIFWSDPHNR